MLWGISLLLRQKTIKNSKKVFLNTLDLGGSLTDKRKEKKTYFQRKNFFRLQQPFQVGFQVRIQVRFQVRIQVQIQVNQNSYFMYLLLSFFHIKICF